MPFVSEHFIMTDIMTFPVPTRFTILYCQAQSFSTIPRNVLKEVLASTVYAASVAMANGWRESKRRREMRGSTGSFWGDLVAYAAVGVLLWVVAFIWQIIIGGGKDKKGE